MALRKCGFECTTASDGSDAVKLITEHGRRFDVVLMDQMMKKMNGTEAVILIRQYEMANGLPWTPIVAVTANTAPEDKDSYFSSGMDGVLGKPVNVRKVGKALLSYIESNRASMQERQHKLQVNINPGVLVEYRSIEDLVLFDPVPPSEEDRDAYSKIASKLTVLLADDRASVAMEKALTQAGISVLVASTGEEVVRMVKERARVTKDAAHIDLLLISQALPGEISAMQAASQIRKHEMGLTLPAVHIVAMVDKFETVDTELCFSSGMNGIISQPVSATTIAHNLIAYCEETAKLREYRFQELKDRKGDLVVEYRHLSSILVFDVPGVGQTTKPGPVTN